MRTNTFRPLIALLFASILVTTVVLGTPPTRSTAQENGTIRGTIINQTTGIPANETEVTLSVFTTDGLIDEHGTTTDGSGHFTFEGMDTADGIVFAASTTYGGVLYSSGMIRFQGTTEQTTEIRIYETTTDRSVVHVGTRGIVLSEIDPEVGEATLLDIYALQVEGNRTFVAGDTGRSLEFAVPRNAASVTPLPGFDFGTPVIENSIVYATSALRPDGGSAQLSYLVRYTGTRFSIETRNPYPTEIFRILVPVELTGASDSITVTANGFVDEGTATIGEREYRVWGVADLEAGSNARIAFESLPKSAFEPNELRVLEPAVLAGVALLGAAAFTTYLFRRGRLQPAAAPAAAPAELIIESRDELVVQLQELQDEYQNGLIDDDVYATERRALLVRIRDASHALRDEPSSD